MGVGLPWAPGHETFSMFPVNLLRCPCVLALSSLPWGSSYSRLALDCPGPCALLPSSSCAQPLPKHLMGPHPAGSCWASCWPWALTCLPGLPAHHCLCLPLPCPALQLLQGKEGAFRQSACCTSRRPGNGSHPSIKASRAHQTLRAEPSLPGTLASGEMHAHPQCPDSAAPPSLSQPGRGRVLQRGCLGVSGHCHLHPYPP